MLTGVAPGKLTPMDVLLRVFAESECEQRPERAKQYPLHVIMQGPEPRWIIIGKPASVMPVLTSWAPWNTSSRMKWALVRLAAKMDAISVLPGVISNSVELDISYWHSKLPEFPDKWSGVIHVGNRSHTRKAILFIVENGTRVACAAKIPLVPDAVGAIFNEADALDQLSQYTYLPRILFRDRLRGIAAQSWLDGKPVGRGFTQAHLDLLQSLVHEGGTMRVCDCRDDLSRCIEDIDIPFDRSVIARGLDLLDCNVPLRSFVEHRDFAPWNLKWIGKGKLGLLDWEWAVSEGLPWQDASRFFYLDDALFHGPGQVWQALINNPLLKCYRREYEIPDNVIPALTMRYLLRELTMECRSGNHRLAQYAYEQIRALLDAVIPSRG